MAESAWMVLLLGSIGGLGTLSYILWQLYSLISYYIWKNYFVSLNINTTDPIYEWVLLWLKRHGPLKGTHHWTVETKRNPFDHSNRPSIAEAEGEKTKKAKYTWRPRPGTHFFKHHKTGQWIRLTIQKNENTSDRFWDVDSTSVSQKTFEIITLEFFPNLTNSSKYHSNSQEVLNDMISEAHAEYTKQNDGKTVVYRYSKEDRLWKVFGKPKEKRPWKTIVTQENIKENIIEDINTFQSSADWYKEHGVPYRRGYLLHGPPGTGKSSLVYGLTGELGYSLCVLTLSDKELTDDDLMNRLATVPSKSLILIEDIDVALPSEKRKKEIETKRQRIGDSISSSGHSQSLTMSGILNAIDGVTTANSQILIMTTNHKEDLDPALIRPGRIDKQFYLDNCSIKQIKTMFRNFFDEAEAEDAEEMGRCFEAIKSPISPAQYESYLSCFKTSSRVALDNIKVLEDSVESEHKLRYIGKTIIYRYNCKEWEPFDKPHAKRPLKTVVTQKGIKEDLLDDILHFQQEEDWYLEHGIPYRRGYLLHGPPGTGKSSLVYSLAGKLDYGICLLSLSDKDLTDNDLMRSLAKVPNKSFVLIEDIDVALPSKKRKKDMDFAKEKGEEVMQTSLTLSGVLNAIDGVASEDSQILFMTTNYKQHLDPALIRPGRVDREFYLDNCNTTQTRDIFSNFFPRANKEEVNKMGQIFESIQAPISPAQLQGYLMRYKKSSSDALENVQVLKDSLELVDENEDCVDSGCSSTLGGSNENINDNVTSKDNEKAKESQEPKEGSDRSL